jgi:hypothetical protein
MHGPKLRVAQTAFPEFYPRTSRRVEIQVVKSQNLVQMSQVILLSVGSVVFFNVFKRSELAFVVECPSFVRQNAEDRPADSHYPLPLTQSAKWIRDMLQNVRSKHEIIVTIGDRPEIAGLRHKLFSEPGAKHSAISICGPNGVARKIARVDPAANPVHRN